MTSTQPVSKGPRFGARKPRLNHVAMSLPADLLDEEHRRLIADFYQDVFGFVELPMLTEDRRRLVLQVHNIEQFLFLIAEEAPMSCPRLDHWGISVGRGVRARRHPRPRRGVEGARRPRRHRRQEDRRPRDARDHEHLRPLPPPDDGRGAVVGLQGNAAREQGATENG